MGAPGGGFLGLDSNSSPRKENANRLEGINFTSVLLQHAVETGLKFLGNLK